MSVSSLTKYGVIFCRRNIYAVKWHPGAVYSVKFISPVQRETRAFSISNSKSNQKHHFWIEGVGSIQASLSGRQLHSNQVHRKSTTTRHTEWELDDTACPQGIQGCADLNGGCGHFAIWLDNCKQYGLADCGEQLQGPQRKLHLPEIGAPCPQGVQGEGCARFKLWQANCHRIEFHECHQQLQGFHDGGLKMSELFAQQDVMIRQVVQQYQQRRSYSTQTPGSTPAAQVGDPAQLSQREKLKRAVKEYGSTVIVFHITISLASLGAFYLAVSSGIDMVGILKSLGIGETILQSKLATGTGTFVVAYAVHKVFAPVRIGITLTATPFIVRFLRNKGILKPPQKTL